MARTRISDFKVTTAPKKYSAMVKAHIVRVTVTLAGERIGGALVVKDKGADYAYVGSIRVQPQYQRKGIGTRIYEAAARASCEAFKLPLASDFHRSKMAQGFWRKQWKKGRAERVKIPEGVKHNSERKTFFMLSCPAPKSLKGLKKA